MCVKEQHDQPADLRNVIPTVSTLSSRIIFFMSIRLPWSCDLQQQTPTLKRCRPNSLNGLAKFHAQQGSGAEKAGGMEFRKARGD